MKLCSIAEFNLGFISCKNFISGFLEIWIETLLNSFQILWWFCFSLVVLEPELQRKKKPIAYKKTAPIATELPSRGNQRDDYMLLGDQSKFNENVKYRIRSRSGHVRIWHLLTDSWQISLNIDICFMQCNAIQYREWIICGLCSFLKHYFLMLKWFRWTADEFVLLLKAFLFVSCLDTKWVGKREIERSDDWLTISQSITIYIWEIDHSVQSPVSQLINWLN